MGQGTHLTADSKFIDGEGQEIVFKDAKQILYFTNVAVHDNELCLHRIQPEEFAELLQNVNYQNLAITNWEDLGFQFSCVISGNIKCYSKYMEETYMDHVIHRFNLYEHFKEYYE